MVITAENVKYTIYTEFILKNDKKVIELISKFYKSFTVIYCKGYWNNISENSIKIEFITTLDQKYTIRNICERIKEINNQETVLLTIERIESELI